MKNLLRAFRFLFMPDICWECGEFEYRNVVKDTMDYLVVEEICECTNCGKLLAMMSYSPWYGAPDTFKERLAHLQLELNSHCQFPFHVLE